MVILCQLRSVVTAFAIAQRFIVVSGQVGLSTAPRKAVPLAAEQHKKAQQLPTPSLHSHFAASQIHWPKCVQSASSAQVALPAPQSPLNRSLYAVLLGNRARQRERLSSDDVVAHTVAMRIEVASPVCRTIASRLILHIRLPRNRKQSRRRVKRHQWQRCSHTLLTQ